MAQFILDTSGEVYTPCPVSWAPNAQNITRWPDLDPFTRAFITALFFTETSSGQTKAAWNFDTAADALPEDSAFDDLHPSALQRVIADCQAFQASRAFLDAMEGYSGMDEEQAGHDFWMTRNGHGCGFWDGDWPEPHASALTAEAKRFGEVDVTFGDDGKVYLS